MRLVPEIAYLVASDTGVYFGTGVKYVVVVVFS